MNKKPSPADLIAYLYDELGEVKRQEIEEYLAVYPKAMEEIENLQEARDVLRLIPKQAVDTPMILLSTPSAPTRKLTWWRPAIGIAATFGFLLLAAGYSGIQIGHNQSGWYFNLGKAQPQKEILSLDSVEALVQNSLKIFSILLWLKPI